MCVFRYGLHVSSLVSVAMGYDYVSVELLPLMGRLPTPR
jgi:hypothetical protein